MVELLCPQDQLSNSYYINIYQSTVRESQCLKLLSNIVGFRARGVESQSKSQVPMGGVGVTALNFPGVGVGIFKTQLHTPGKTTA